MSGAAILYDRDCGFCRWSLARFLAWDRGLELRPVALQDPEAHALLGSMSEQDRMGSWHLVDEDGVHSAGAGLGPLLRRLPGGGPLAALAEAAPALTERAYRLVAGNRDRLGPLLPDAARERATRRIDERAARKRQR